MRKRGVEDFELAMIDPWASSYTGPEDHPSERRICRPLTWVRSAPGEHGYARPVEGLVATVDLDAMEVVDVADYGVVPLPPQPGNYEEPWIFEDGNVPAFTQYRDDVKPIEITQPEGPSFTVDGHHVQLAEVGPADRLHAARGPRPAPDRLRRPRHAAADHLPRRPGGDVRALRRPGAHAPVQERLRPGRVRHRLAGQPADARLRLRRAHPVLRRRRQRPGRQPASRSRTRSACTRRTRGSAWKHTDFRTEEVEVRRLRRLVISTIVTVGNYEYGYFWYLYNDGTIEYEVKLTGVLSTGAITVGETPEYGTLVGPGLYGAEPPALLLRAAGHGGRRPAEHGRRGRLGHRAGRARQPDGQRLEDGAEGPRDASRGGPVDRPDARRASGRSRARSKASALGRADRVQAHAGRQRGADVRPGDAATARARASRRRTSGSRRTTRRSASPPATTRTSTPAARACRRTSRPTSRSSARTSWSGTRSARTTSCGRRTGR